MICTFLCCIIFDLLFEKNNNKQLHASPTAAENNNILFSNYFLTFYLERNNLPIKAGVDSLCLVSLFYFSIITFQLVVNQVVGKNATLLHLSVALSALYSGLVLISGRHRVFSANHRNFREHVFLLAAYAALLG